MDMTSNPTHTETTCTIAAQHKPQSDNSRTQDIDKGKADRLPQPPANPILFLGRRLVHRPVVRLLPATLDGDAEQRLDLNPYA